MHLVGLNCLLRCLIFDAFFFVVRHLKNIEISFLFAVMHFVSRWDPVYLCNERYKYQSCYLYDKSTLHFLYILHASVVHF